MNVLTEWRVRIMARWNYWRKAANSGTSPSAKWVRYGVLGLVGYLVISLILGIWWSFTPGKFDVAEQATKRAEAHSGKVVTGAVTTSTLLTVAETLMHKSGGYLSNDRLPPGVWLDNMPNWEYGVLIQIRDLSKAMRESFSRSQTQSLEDKDLAKTEARFNSDSNFWMLPATESQYKDGIEFLQSYFDRLIDEDDTNAQFYARADNLRFWLSTVETRLGSLSQRLSASVGQRRVNTDLAGDSEARQATYSPSEKVVKTPFFEIDDVVYEARGSAWAILHFLKAVESDFGKVLDKKNARVSLRQIIRELEATQRFIWSPMILNGSGFGMLANHSLVMASYLSRANAALIDLRTLLAQG